jgi:hypothetical protein
MPHTGQPLPTSTSLEPMQSRKYFKLQLKAWTNFDPAQEDLTAIADAIRKAEGFITVMEVTEVSGLKEITDPEVRERFASVEAAEKILQNLDKLPTSVREQLYSALATQRPTAIAESLPPRTPEYKAA